MNTVAALSVDLEYFSDLPAYPDDTPTPDADVGRSGVTWLLKRFEERDVQSTFFVVSRIAEATPNIIRRVADANQEIASHTHTHRHLSELSPDERDAELTDSKEILETVSGASITGFRAPSFDTSSDHFSLLADAGYGYDSSFVPARPIPGWYGGDCNRKRPHPVRAGTLSDGERLIEVPLGVMPRLKLPLSGAWLRFFGVRYTIAGMRALARRGVAPVLYIHPWELVDLPQVQGVPKRVYWRTGSYMRRAVERILQSDFEFVTVDEIAHHFSANKESTKPENE